MRIVAREQTWCHLVRVSLTIYIILRRKRLSREKLKRHIGASCGYSSFFIANDQRLFVPPGRCIFETLKSSLVVEYFGFIIITISLFRFISFLLSHSRRPATIIAILPFIKYIYPFSIDSCRKKTRTSPKNP